ncbi:MAG: aminoglycoside phosphotransferase family protein [Bacilli bacterium]|jgi:Ser/Thr protein kinase RdoA (MazF antagonist)|nr:aminoglycoside phosphotransferase family protein [Bacilli bacterium]
MNRSIPSFLADALKAFSLWGRVTSLSLNRNGRVNDTYVVGTEAGRFILQKVNRFVFPRPERIMANIVGVSSFLREAAAKRGGDPRRETLQVVPTEAGSSYFEAPDGSFFRCFAYIEGALVHPSTRDPGLLYEAGRLLGRFEKDLSRYPLGDLYETIPSFHDTKKRYGAFLEAVASNPLGRAASCREEIESCVDNRALSEPIAGLPVRVTHNDPKLTNVMFDAESGRALALIDLDTVMPGYSVFDFGDAVRYDCSSGDEDGDPKGVSFLLRSYEAFLRGYLSLAKGFLTPLEKANLSRGALQMGYECGLRFLTDYLLGDVYFKVMRPGDNLARARSQIRLLASMKEKKAQMDSLVR